MSYATIISICPAEIKQTLPHTTPPFVTIPPGEIDKPILAVFNDAEERKFVGGEIDKKNPWVSYPVLAFDFAKAIASSYKGSATYVNPNAYPAVFAVPVKPDFVTPERNDYVIVPFSDLVAKFVSSFADELKQAKEIQYNWFKKLVQVADQSFAKNSNYAEISTLQRYASRVLNQERPWNKEIKPEDFKKCPYCASFVEPAAVICIQCHNVVDPEGFKKLQASMNPTEVKKVV